MRNKILLIPHAPAVEIRTRADALATALADLGMSVDIYKRSRQPRGLGLSQKAQWHVKEAFRTIEREPLTDNHNILKLPTLHRFEPMKRVWEFFVGKRLMDGGYQSIISSAYDGYMLRGGGKCRFVYDYVDDHADGFRRAGHLRWAERIARFVENQIQSADQLIASSNYLKNLIESRYGRRADLIPNGAPVETIRQAIASHAQVRPVGEFRVGYMGGLDYFVRIDWVIEAIATLRKKGLPIRLVVIGKGSMFPESARTSWIDDLGFRQPNEIPSLLNRFDVGIIPFEISPFTDAALPLKAIEYAASRMRVLSSPIAELKHIGFPWIRFVDPSVAGWQSAIAEEYEHSRDQRRWDQAWDSLVDQYSWNSIALNLKKRLDDHAN